MYHPLHQESTTRQQLQQQQRDHSNTSTATTALSASASPAHSAQADLHEDTELSSTGTNFRAASLAASSEQQSTNQHPIHTRPTSHGHNNNNLRTTASSNGNGTNKSSTDRATTGGANATAAAMGMGDGIINQSMKEDLDSKPTEPRRCTTSLIAYFLNNEADNFLISPSSTCTHLRLDYGSWTYTWTTGSCCWIFWTLQGSLHV